MKGLASIKARLRALWPTKREVDLTHALQDLNDVHMLAVRIEALGFEADAQALRRAAVFAARRVSTALAVYRPTAAKSDDDA